MQIYPNSSHPEIIFSFHVWDPSTEHVFVQSSQSNAAIIQWHVMFYQFFLLGNASLLVVKPIEAEWLWTGRAIYIPKFRAKHADMCYSWFSSTWQESWGLLCWLKVHSLWVHIAQSIRTSASWWRWSLASYWKGWYWFPQNICNFWPLRFWALGIQGVEKSVSALKTRISYLEAQIWLLGVWHGIERLNVC